MSTKKKNADYLKQVLTEVSDDGESRAAYDREGLQQMREAGNTAPEAAELLPI